MKKRIILRLSNEIGNQLFMYASAYSISKKMDRELLLDNETAFLSKKNISNFGLDNFGLVYSLGKNSTKNNCSDCVKFNLGVGYNKVNDFKESVYYAGYNNSNSIIDYFLKQSQGIPLSQLGSSSPLSEKLNYQLLLFLPNHHQYLNDLKYQNN